MISEIRVQNKIFVKFVLFVFKKISCKRSVCKNIRLIRVIRVQKKLVFNYKFLPLSISRVSSLASVIAILATTATKAMHHDRHDSNNNFPPHDHLNLAATNCGTFHNIFSIFVKVGFIPCD